MEAEDYNRSRSAHRGSRVFQTQKDKKKNVRRKQTNRKSTRSRFEPVD